MNNKLIILITTILVVIAIFYLFLGKNIADNSLQSQFSNEANVIGGDFNLIDKNNKSFDSSMLKGSLSLVYFGFTACPDVCIESLQKIDKVLEILDQYKININPVFITLDPKRDTSDTLRDYFKHYNAKFIALTGSNEQISHTANKYKVYYTIKDNQTATNYFLDHSTFIYLLDTNGLYIKHFTIDSDPLEIVNYIRTVNNND